MHRYVCLGVRYLVKFVYVYVIPGRYVRLDVDEVCTWFWDMYVYVRVYVTLCASLIDRQ